MKTFSTLEGEGALLAKLKRLKRMTRGEVLANASLDGAYIHLRETKRRTPVDTGNLRASYQAEITERQANYGEAQTGTNVEYGPPVEYGTENQAAQPHVRPAFDENTARIARAQQLALKREMDALI